MYLSFSKLNSLAFSFSLSNGSFSLSNGYYLDPLNSSLLHKRLLNVHALSHPLILFFFLYSFFFFLFEKLTHLHSLTVQTIPEIQQAKLKPLSLTFSQALFLSKPEVQNQSMERLAFSYLFLFISLLTFAGKITSLRLSHFPFFVSLKVFDQQRVGFFSKKKKNRVQK